MTKDQILKTLKTAGYNAVPGKTGNSLIVYVSKDTNRKSFLSQDIPAIFKDSRPVYTTSGPVKSSAGATSVNGTWIVAKPMAATGAGGNLASLDARIFVKKGRPIEFFYADEKVKAVEFTDPNVLRQSIVEGTRDNKLLGPNLAEMLEEYFQTKKFTWPLGTSMDVMNKFGVYAGEVLVGYCIMKQDFTAFESNIPFKGKVKRFIMPTDPSFSGVDSFIEMQNGVVYGLSSKFDVGAKASVFSNLLPKGVAKFSKLQPSVFRTFCETAIKANLQPQKSKEIVYEYGVRKILGFTPKEIKTPTMVFDQIKSGKLGPEAKMVVAKIKTLVPKYNIPSKISTTLPQSVSSFFNYVIAMQLNTDKKSIEQIIAILAAKDYWQSNLNKAKWYDGSLSFKVSNSGQAKVIIDGAKSPAQDITAKQGWLNYLLK